MAGKTTVLLAWITAVVANCSGSLCVVHFHTPKPKNVPALFKNDIEKSIKIVLLHPDL